MNNTFQAELTRRLDAMVVGDRKHIYGVLVRRSSMSNWRVSGVGMSRDAAVKEIHRKGVAIQRDFENSIDN